MNLKDLFTSVYFKNFLLALGGAVILIFVFSAGVFVGVERAKFSYGWGENYFRNFVASPGSLPGLPGREPFWDKSYLNPHGLVGEIIKIDDNSVILKDQNNLEIPVIVDDDTAIRNRQQNLRFEDLQVGDHLVVIGAPDNQGEISAKFIRVNAGF
ncbi:MAG TPA: hypothetical protein VMD74_02870 [Candidatus Methylomirabilis sp.]|nr:hypothetical protein [Candidatus Methylomirabilis sp.]